MAKGGKIRPGSHWGSQTHKIKKACAYCGELATTVDHVVPSALYPPSKAGSRVQRITVDACGRCNGGWSNDEAHFRNVLLMAAGPNPVTIELWRGPTARSFDQPDRQSNRSQKKRSPAWGGEASTHRDILSQSGRSSQSMVARVLTGAVLSALQPAE